MIEVSNWYSIWVHQIQITFLVIVWRIDPFLILMGLGLLLVTSHIVGRRESPIVGTKIPCWFLWPISWCSKITSRFKIMKSPWWKTSIFPQSNHQLHQIKSSCSPSVYHPWSSLSHCFMDSTRDQVLAVGGASSPHAAQFAAAPGMEKWVKCCFQTSGYRSRWRFPPTFPKVSKRPTSETSKHRRVGTYHDHYGVVGLVSCIRGRLTRNLWFLSWKLQISPDLLSTGSNKNRGV